jgi:hypothetical protein
MTCNHCKEEITEKPFKWGGYWAKVEQYYHQECKSAVDKSIYEMQLIDTNCNDCIFLERSNKKVNNILYGKCKKLNKDITFIPKHCMIENQDCFKHRK